MHSAQVGAQTLSVANINLKPHVLQQLDDGTTIDQSRGGGEVAGAGRVGGKPLRVMMQYEHSDVGGGLGPRSQSALASRGQLRF